MKFSHPLLGVFLAIGFVLFVFTYLCTSTSPLLAASSVAPSSFCGVSDTTYDNRMAQTIRPTLRFHNHSFTCSPPGRVLAANCYAPGSYCNQDRQCCSGICNIDDYHLHVGHCN